MALYSDKDKRHKYKYSVVTINIILENETIKLPKERVANFEIIHNYTTNLYPIFQLNITLEPSVYYKILKHKDTVKFQLRIQKYYTNIGSETKSLSRDVWNTTFGLILDDDEFNVDEALRELEAKNDYTNTTKSDVNDLYQTDNLVEFFLYKTDMIKAGKTIINSVLQNATSMDALCYIATVAKFPTMLVGPTDNKKEYSELVLPPLSAVEELKHVDSYYGFYKSGSIIYFDFDRLYVLPYSGKCVAYTKNEIKDTTIIIPSQTSSYSTDTCSLVKSSNTKCNYIIASPRYTKPSNNATTQGVLVGNNLISVDATEGSVNDDSSNSSSSISKTVVLENNTENPYFNEIYKAQSSAEDTVLEVYLGDYDIDVLKPNKKINIVFEDTKYTQKYKGTYLISMVEHSFVRDGADFKVVTHLIVKKTSK